jgi:hypothetical protein
MQVSDSSMMSLSEYHRGKGLDGGRDQQQKHPGEDS